MSNLREMDPKPAIEPQILFAFGNDSDFDATHGANARIKARPANNAAIDKTTEDRI